MVAEGHHAILAVFENDLVAADGVKVGDEKIFGRAVEPFSDLAVGHGIFATATDAEDEQVDGVLEFIRAVNDG